MEKHAIRFNAIAIATLAALATLAGCGGGGGNGGGGSIPSVGAANPSPSATSSAPPSSQASATPAPQIAGVVSINNAPVANGTVIYSCGCSLQAGIAPTDQSGNYVLPLSGPAIPATPSPTYTMVPGRNYLIVAKSPQNAEAWTMAFLGKTPAHNLSLGPSATQSADVYSAAAALYIYFASPTNGPQADLAFTQWNFNAILQWTQHMRSVATTGLTQAEQKLVTDIGLAQAANTTLFPGAPPWYSGTAPQPNTTIKADLSALHSSVGTQGADPAIPTPCPGGEGFCTGTPSP
ncbi:MAG: hypothetical protein ACXWNK_00310 [Vulcanimicrobiaceae bacterium]